jgi:GTP-binding protein
VAANKMDLAPPAEEVDALASECESRGLRLHRISVATSEGIGELTRAMMREVEIARAEGISTGEQVVYEPPSEEPISVTGEGGRFVVTGKRIERLVSMTDWSNEEARAHLGRKLKDVGVEGALARSGARAGDEVEIAGREFEYIPEGTGLAGTPDAPSAGDGEDEED